MSLNSAMYTGVSGLSAYSKAISVIGNNIANVNTPGFKESRGNFADMLSASAGTGGTLQIGRGVLVNNVTPVFTQGAFQSTTLPGDLAIDGEGLFVVKDPKTSVLLYTRTGNFTLNREGKLTNPQGLVLQGFDVDSMGNPQPGVKDVNLFGQSSPPKLTSNATMNGVLSAEDVPIPPDPPLALSTSMKVYDSLGIDHEIFINFQKTAANSWNWSMETTANELAGGIGTSRVVVGSGEMTFDVDGDLVTVVPSVPPSNQVARLTLDFAGGAQAGQQIDFDLQGITQTGDISAAGERSQDGYTSGILQSFNIDERGVVMGSFSTGAPLPLKSVALAKFPSTVGLKQVGKNLFSESLLSGQPIVAAPGTSGLGGVQSGALEISNVDLSEQFVELIRAQQAFQANARIITTSDQLLTETVNLKR